MLDTIMNVVLWLLSFLSVTLLVILGIVVFLILIVLFVPIGYKGVLLKRADVVQAQVKVNWLFRIVRVYINYEKGLLVKAYVLFLKIYDSNKPAKEKSRKKLNNTKERPKEKSQNDSDIKEETSDHDNVKEAVIKEETGSVSDVNNADKKQDDTECYSHKSLVLKIITKIKTLIDNIICKCKSICDKIKFAVQNISYYAELLKEEETKLIFGRVLKRFLQVIKSIRPRKFNADITMGTGSPDTTGYLMAVAGVLYPYLGKHVNITPDFDNTIFEGRIQFKGQVTIFIIIIHALSIYIDKELRNLLIRLKREDT